MTTAETTELHDFAELVQKMRSSQIEFFRTKSASALQCSKLLEKQVDQALARISNNQKTLW